MQKRLREWEQELFTDVVIAFLLAAFFMLFIGGSRAIPTESMVPTIQPGDRIYSEKVTYRFRAPVRGEIVVFRPPFESRYPYIKRIIGLPGEVVAVQEGKVYINGEPLDEPYVAEPMRYELPPTQIPEGHYFVLGDNRNGSYDSHIWGFLDVSRIRERALFRYWPSLKWLLPS